MSESITLIVCGGGESAPGKEHGTPPIHVCDDWPCPDCGESHMLEQCPDCGGHDIYHGYGLGFGPGIGAYKCCLAEGCGWSWKLEDDDG